MTSVVIPRNACVRLRAPIPTSDDASRAGEALAVPVFGYLLHQPRVSLLVDAGLAAHLRRVITLYRLTVLLAIGGILAALVGLVLLAPLSLGLTQPGPAMGGLLLVAVPLGIAARLSRIQATKTRPPQYPVALDAGTVTVSGLDAQAAATWASQHADLGVQYHLNDPATN